jgi:hypothetical protein
LDQHQFFQQGFGAKKVDFLLAFLQLCTEMKGKVVKVEKSSPGISVSSAKKKRQEIKVISNFCL